MVSLFHTTIYAWQVETWNQSEFHIPNRYTLGCVYWPYESCETVLKQKICHTCHMDNLFGQSAFLDALSRLFWAQDNITVITLEFGIRMHVCMIV